MSSPAGVQQQTVGEALARRVEARRGTESVWVEALRELGAVDRAVYQAVADTPTPELDAPVRIPDGVSPAAAMLQAARDAEPRRQSVLEEALANRQATSHITRSIGRHRDQRPTIAPARRRRCPRRRIGAASLIRV